MRQPKSRIDSVISRFSIPGRWTKRQAIASVLRPSIGGNANCFRRVMGALSAERHSPGLSDDDARRSPLPPWGQLVNAAVTWSREMGSATRSHHLRHAPHDLSLNISSLRRRQRCMIRYPPALLPRHHVNTVYVIAVITSFNCGVDVICHRAIEPDSTGQHARTYPTEEACIDARNRFRAQHDATHQLDLKCIPEESALPYVTNH
jgi:hypothetical protein